MPYRIAFVPRGRDHASSSVTCLPPRAIATSTVRIWRPSPPPGRRGTRWPPRQQSPLDLEARRTSVVARPVTTARAGTTSRDRSGGFTSEVKVLGRRADEDDQPVFHRRQLGASCCALLKRWISSRNRIVRCSVLAEALARPRSPARTPSPARSLRTAARALVVASAINRRHQVVLPVPGGPQR